MYTHKKINEDTYQIIDEYKDAMYLIIGEVYALLIDTGMSKDSLLDYVKTLTNKQIKVVLTHGHHDHCGGAYHFDEVYLSSKDYPLYISQIEKASEKSIFLKAPSDLLEMPDYFDLGNKDLLVYPLSGHSSGSILLIDAANKCVYTGDAIGSGKGVWMQLEESLDVLSYKVSLEKALQALKRIGVDDLWSFYGGHFKQEYESKVSNYNPINLSLMEDMVVLCRKVIDNQIDYQQTDEPSFKHKDYYIAYQKAEMILSKDKLYTIN